MANSNRRIINGRIVYGKVGTCCRFTTPNKTIRAGLIFPVARLHRYLKKILMSKDRIGGTASVYMAAVLEYLAAEIIELAGRISKDLRVRRITPRHIQLAIRNDD